jgi:hypothetical protein
MSFSVISFELLQVGTKLIDNIIMRCCKKSKESSKEDEIRMPAAEKGAVKVTHVLKGFGVPRGKKWKITASDGYPSPHTPTHTPPHTRWHEGQIAGVPTSRKKLIIRH